VHNFQRWDKKREQVLLSIRATSHSWQIVLFIFLET